MKVNSDHLKTRIFLYEFVWSRDLIRHIVELCNERDIEICGWAVRRKDISRLTSVWAEVPLYEGPLPSNLSSVNYESNLLNGFSFEEEENIHFLLDREGMYQNNMHSSQVRYQVYAWVETVLKQCKPDWLLFPDVPHNIFTYMLYLCGKRNGIKILMIRRGLAPHLFTLSETIERKLSLDSFKNGSIEVSSQTSAYLKVLRYGDETSPIYMVNQRRNSRPMQIVKRSLAKGFDLFTKKSIGAAFTYIKRRRLKQFYESICDPRLDLTKAKPYIVAFLHLQPERSTIPEGGVFAQQWLMVQMLSAVCAADGWNLYVREHPSTFMVGPKFYRGKWFYNGLKALPNVSLVSTSVNSNSILKNAKAVATVTGTVGIEAVAKGIPALLFGESPFVGCAGTYRIKCEADLKAAISSIKAGVEIEFDDIKRFFSAWERDENCHNTGLERIANHSGLWLQGVPQAVMFSKMVLVIENEKLSSLNNVN
jgi:hypothetical protein